MSNKTGTHAHSQNKTARMIEGFIGLWDQGYSIPDIAKAFDLDQSVVYRQLGEIAERAGLPGRECFLVGRKGAKRIHTKPQPDDGTLKNEQDKKPNTAPLQPLEPNAVNTLFDAAINNLKGLIDGVQQTINTYSVQPNIGGESNA